MNKSSARLIARQVAIAALLAILSLAVRAEVTIGEAAKSLPDKIESFRAKGPAQLPTVGIFERVRPEEVGAASQASRRYINDARFDIIINLIQTQTESGAYALLTRLAAGKEDVKPGVAGTASVVSSSWIAFCKGSNLVQIWPARTGQANQEQLLHAARVFATSLDSGDGDLPVLVKHLPNWQSAMARASYSVSLEGLKANLTGQPILDALNFEGGTEAVVANYGQAQLVIVEFTTPQFSIDNDQRIVAKLQELKNQGPPVPTAYRRVGNYSVFVFNAWDEKGANQLIDQVKYQQVVQWLGDDPHLFERIQRAYVEMSAGVFVAVMKSSGLSLLACLGVGGLIGALMFRRRRAHQRQAAVYSDAGGMVRLNLDEITGISDPHRLLGPGKRPESDSAGS